MQFSWLVQLAVRASVCHLFSLSAGFVQLGVSFTTNCSGQGWFWGCCMRQDGSHRKWGKNQNNHVLGEEIQKWQNAISDVSADRMSDTASILNLCNPTFTNLFYQTRWISWGKPEPYLKKYICGNQLLAASVPDEFCHFVLQRLMTDSVKSN